MSSSVASPSRSAVASRYVRTFLDRHASLMPTFAAVVIFIALLIGAEIHFGEFVTPRNMSALLLDNAYLVILAVVLGGTSLMGGKFTIAGTVIGVLIIQTLKSTILFLGVPSAQSPVFFAAVVILVVLIQSPRLHRMARRLTGRTHTPQAPQAPAQKDAEVPA